VASGVAGSWLHTGMILVGFVESTAPSGAVSTSAYCASLHLTDFSSVKNKTSFLVVTDIDPIGDAGKVSALVWCCRLLVCRGVARHALRCRLLVHACCVHRR
jgi:hypothetical protein